jgi:hypothetical protein
MATLTWERRDGQRMVFQLQAPEVTIGRGAGNVIRIESTYVSKHHAVVRLGPRGYTIADLNSSNGTLVNGRNLTPAPLSDGDRLELGAEILIFSDPVAGARPAAVPPSRKRGLILLAGGGGVLILGLVLLIIIGGAPAREGPGASPAGSSTAPPAAAPGPVAAPAASPQPSVLPPAQSMAGSTPPAASPAGAAEPAGPLPSNDPATLYEIAMSHVKGQRYLEARRLLQAAVRLDPGNVSAEERLRELDATIAMLADRHMSAGQRAFSYLRYDDAIREWEQVLSMVEPADPRAQQAADGIRRAKERLVQR